MVYAHFVAEVNKKAKQDVSKRSGPDITSNQLNYSQKPESNEKYSSYHLFYSPDNHDVRSVAWKDDGIGCLK
jgi:hypothetical protein